MLIGELSDKAGVSIDTVRYYERQGLMKPLRVRDSGYREFDESAVSRLHFIHRAKMLGFSLQQIKILLTLKEAPSTTCGDVRFLVKENLADIQQKIKALREMERELLELLQECTNPDARAKACPIVETMDGKRK